METDWHIGRLLQTLDRLKIAENTLVFFSSDNGPENTWKQRIEKFGHHSAGPYREGKRSIYEGGHRVPLIVRWPDRVEAGRTVHRTVCQTDLLATLADIVGDELTEHAGEDSVSFFASLTGDEATSERPPVIHHASNGRFAIRSGRWKLVMEYKGQSRELYHLGDDPGETTNVIDDHRDVEERLFAAIQRIVQTGRSTPGTSVGNDTPLWNDVSWARDEP